MSRENQNSSSLRQMVCVVALVSAVSTLFFLTWMRQEDFYKQERSVTAKQLVGIAEAQRSHDKRLRSMLDATKQLADIEKAQHLHAKSLRKILDANELSKEEQSKTTKQLADIADAQNLQADRLQKMLDANKLSKKEQSETTKQLVEIAEVQRLQAKRLETLFRESSVKDRVSQVRKKKGKEGGPDVLSPVTNDPLEEARWEKRYFEQFFNRYKGMLKESAEELHSTRARLEVLYRIVSDAEKPREVPCHCLETSSMAPGNTWCDNSKARISGSHVCILRNVCMVNGQAHIISEREPPGLWNRSAGMVIPTGARQMDIAGTQHELRIVYKPEAAVDQTFKNGNAPTYQFFKDAPVITGTTVLYASKYPSHITHVLEGAGSLQLAISRMNTDPCNASDPTCFGSVTRFVFMGGRVGSWHENMLRVMIGDVEKKVKFQANGDISSPECFEKVIVPGFYYSIFPDTESTEPFQDTVKTYVERNANVSYTNTPRKILLSFRSSKRSIKDWPLLVGFIKNLTADVNKRNEGRNPILVEEIEFGSLPFEGQVSAVATANILMGLHGADLTNIMFMRRGSVLIELNPLFFFENRFFEIATNLGMHYMAWTCTHEDCAFGGAKARFKEDIRTFGFGYDFQRRVFQKDGKEFRYPFDRYLGYACQACESIASDRYRDTETKVKESLGEIETVMLRAFKALGW